MKTDKTILSNKITEQQEAILHLREENNQLNLETAYLKEQIKLLQAQLFSKKSERKSFDPDLAGQLHFLDILGEEPPQEKPVTPPSVPIAAHTRKKSGRKPLPEDLPRVEVYHDVSDDQKQCACGGTKCCIGKEILEQLEYIPAILRVICHIRFKYACPICEGIETEGGTVVIAPPPKQILPKSIASPSLLAHIITAKFVDSLPFYRQEKQFARLGYALSRTNMSNWTIQLRKCVAKLLGLLKQEVLSGPLIHMDETTLQVLKEPGRAPTSKSYMWVMRGGAPENPSVYFHYSPTRASTVAHALLESYHGVVQTDGYAGYDFINHFPEMLHAGCWAHSRRKFMDILKAMGKCQPKKTRSGHAEDALSFIGRLYGIERQATENGLDSQQRFEIRQEQSKPILEAFHRWLKQTENQTPPRGLLGKAIGYTLKRWEELTLYLDHGFVPMDNNLAENAIRPFVVGRKNFLFCDTVAGAEAMASLYSLVETAKANHLNPTVYLKTLFEKLPYAETEDQLRSLLPQCLKATINELN